MKLIHKIGIGFGALVLIGAFVPSTPKATTTKTATPPPPALDYTRVSYQGQLLTDYKVGQVLGDIKCGKTPVRDGIDFLNVNGVPKALLEDQTSEVTAGFVSATRWC